MAENGWPEAWAAIKSVLAGDGIPITSDPGADSTFSSGPGADAGAETEPEPG